MNHHNTETIKAIVESHIPELEATLASYTSHDNEVNSSTTLYTVNCGLATAALQYLLDVKYGIKTDRMITRLENPDPESFKRLSHVVLRHGDIVIDPTPNQFMQMVGLTTEHAQEKKLQHLYPDKKIWVANPTEMRERVNMFAEHAYRLDQQGLVPKPDQSELGIYGVGVLRGKSLDEMRNVYQTLWDPENYELFPVEDQREQFQKIGHDLITIAKKQP